MQAAFLLLSPDSILSGAAVGILQQLEKQNLEIIRYEWRLVTEGNVANLYRANRESRGYGEVDKLVDMLFSKGESLCCLISNPLESDAMCLHQKILDIKGSSSPFRCKPSQIRRAFGATNKILNLVHSSDSPTDSARESDLLLEASAPVGNAAHLMYPQLIKQAQLRAINCSISAFQIANKIKRSIINSLTGSLIHENLRLELLREFSIVNSSIDQVTIYPELSQSLRLQSAIIRNYYRNEAGLQLIQRLINISMIGDRVSSDYAHQAPEMPIDIEIKNYGLKLDDWDSLVLRAQEVTR